MKPSQPQVSVIIPVFNEARTIVEAVTKVAELKLNSEIIVVDDCSSDGTTELLKELQPVTPFRLITHKVNQGKSAGVLAGAAVASGEYLVVEDADLELDPHDFVTMIRMLQADPSLDLINGDRKLSDREHTNLISKLAAIVTRIFLKVLYGKSVRDLLSSYKVCKLSKFRELNLQPHRFTLESEWLIKALLAGWKIREIPIEYHPRSNKAGKKINWMDGVDIILTIIKLRFQH